MKNLKNEPINNNNGCEFFFFLGPSILIHGRALHLIAWEGSSFNRYRIIYIYLLKPRTMDIVIILILLISIHPPTIYKAVHMI